MVLELWKELVDDDDDEKLSRKVFVHVPYIVLYQLVRLLCILRLATESLEYVNPMINMVTRFGVLKLIGGYDSTVDYEFRDQSLEFIVKLAIFNTIIYSISYTLLY